MIGDREAYARKVIESAYAAPPPALVAARELFNNNYTDAEIDTYFNHSNLPDYQVMGVVKGLRALIEETE